MRKNNVALGQTLVKSTGRSCVAWGHRRRGHHPSTGTRCLCRETCSEALALQRCLVGSDSEGVRTPAGRAQWISSPSPWPLGHTVSGVVGKETYSSCVLVKEKNVAAEQTLVKSTGPLHGFGATETDASCKYGHEVPLQEDVPRSS